MEKDIDTDDLLELLNTHVFPLLKRKYQCVIEDDRVSVDIAMEVDDFLQFALLDGVRISDDILDVAEAEVRGGWDPELTERTLGWIAKHREKNAGA
ncbi:hypothetical protein [Trueperella bialowiezensis]|uniref:Uncharacterized protein n=1 Tax=Trueperella bialowiezensis TaxID=312285 RepID=A0A3S5EW22_9ACTO|nr:hypothetical protein [Trueperella bialowiezensis]VEI13265.1 Uncharacterised protein [Trueperella bialowiezensis]